jgi:hypothetical protein
MQSRFNLPGWYSLGAGLSAMDDHALLQEMYDGWAFFRTLLNNSEISLLKGGHGYFRPVRDLVPINNWRMDSSTPSARNMNAHAMPSLPSAGMLLCWNLEPSPNKPSNSATHMSTR